MEVTSETARSELNTRMRRTEVCTSAPEKTLIVA